MYKFIRIIRGEGRSRLYIFMRNLVKRLLCLARGIKKAGTNVYISPLATIKNEGSIEIDDSVVIEKHAELIVNSKKASIKLGTCTYLASYCRLETGGGWIKLGKECGVSRFSILAGQGGLDIGDYVRIGPHVVIYAANHLYSDPETPVKYQGFSAKGVHINDDVWIGAGAIILDGVTIGKGSIIGAGAVVTKDIPPYSVAVGIPARVIKKRE
jgi:acetyltransferase-like isoleucine patch superfamily enzyme